MRGWMRRESPGSNPTADILSLSRRLQRVGDSIPLPPRSNEPSILRVTVAVSDCDYVVKGSLAWLMLVWAVTDV